MIKNSIVTVLILFMSAMSAGSLPVGEVGPIEIDYTKVFHGRGILISKKQPFTAVIQRGDLKQFTQLHVYPEDITLPLLRQLISVMNIKELTLSFQNVVDIKMLNDVLSQKSIKHVRLRLPLGDNKDLFGKAEADAVFSKLNQARHLISLGLTYLPEGIDLKMISHVKFLHLHGYLTDATTIKRLTSLPNLQSVYFGCTRLSADAFKNLSDLKNLHSIYLANGYQIKPEDISQLSKLRKLTKLTDIYSVRSEEAFEAITEKLTQLRTLEIPNYHIRVRDLEYFKRMRNLTSVVLRSNNLTMDDLKTIADYCPKLQLIQLAGSLKYSELREDIVIGKRKVFVTYYRR